MYYEDDTEYIQIAEKIKRVKKEEDFDWSNYIIKKKLTINQKIKLFDEFSKVLKDALLNSI